MKRLEWILFALSALLLGFWGWSMAQSYIYQKAESRRLDALRAERDRKTFTADAARAESRASGLIGRMEVPRLDLSGIIAEGIEEPTLKRAIGHVPRTAFPGEPGNVGLAGHRDSFFRELKDIAVSDTIRITTPDGHFSYVVDTMLVVMPDRGDLLDSTAVPSLTLVTCYPFSYWGRAPKRYVVRARQVEADPSADSLAAPPGASISIGRPGNPDQAIAETR